MDSNPIIQIKMEKKLSTLTLSGLLRSYISGVKGINKEQTGKNNYGAAELSKDLGVNNLERVQGWIKNSNPSLPTSIEDINKIISFFGIKEFDNIPKNILDSALDRYRNNSKKQTRQVPVYNVQAMAGNENEADMTAITIPDTFVSATDLDIANNVDAVIYIWGQSMSPNYAPGTKLALELNVDSFFSWGECYVVETRSNRLFKRVFPSKKGDEWISCHSDNTMTFETGSRKGELAYPPMDIPLSDIIRKFDVVASQKMHKTSKIQYLRELRENA